MSPRPTKDARARDLALIHIARADLRMTDEAYRALLHAVAGVASAKDLDAAGRAAVIARLRALGWAPQRRAAPAPGDWRAPRIAKARALWTLLVRAGVIRAPSEGAWLRFCARQTGVARPEWASSEALNQLVEALKGWCDRERVARDG